MSVSLVLVHWIDSIFVHHAFVDIYCPVRFVGIGIQEQKKGNFHGTIYLDIKFRPKPICLWNNNKLQLIEIFVNCREEM